MMVKEAVLTEVFSTPKGSVYQCDATNSFIVEFAGTTTRFNVKQFIDFKKVISQINLQVMLERIEKEFDLELIYLPQTDNLYTLNVCEVYHLQELLAGAKAMLELNSILHECNIVV
jgi:hypothetical protein